MASRLRTIVFTLLLLLLGIQSIDCHKRGTHGRTTRRHNVPDTPDSKRVIDICEVDNDNAICKCTMDKDKDDNVLVDCDGEQLRHARFKLPPTLDDKIVRVLKLRDMKLENLRKGDLFPDHAPEIEELYLDDNNIVEVEKDAFDKFENLRILSLNNNKLHADSLKHLVSHKVAKGLRGLSLMDNEIGELTSKPFAYYEQLGELSLCGNPLATIGTAAFTGLPELRILKMNDCGLHAAHVPWLRFDKLERLQLKHNKFHTVPFLEDLPTLRSLDLSNNDGISEVAAGSLNKLSNLTHLTISNIDRLWGVNENAFRGLHRLEKLTMTDNPKLYYIDPLAFSKMPSFTHNKLVIDLENNALESWSGSNLNMSSVKQMNLVKNPWNCDCHLKWMTTDEVAIKLKPMFVKCAAPDGVKGKLISTIEADSMECTSRLHSVTAKLVHSATVLMWSMFALLVMLAVVGTYIIKNDGLPCRPVGNGGVHGTRTILSRANPLRRKHRDNDPSFDYRSLRTKFGESPDAGSMPTDDDLIPGLSDVAEHQQHEDDDSNGNVQPAFV